MKGSIRMNVGFVGLGRMGYGMAQRILSGGHDLAVFDVMRDRTAALAAAGARAAESVSDLCRGRDVVVTMLAEDAHVHDVALGSGGLRDSLPPGAVHLAMGTYGIGTIRALASAHAAAGQGFAAAPVLGRPDLAASGQLGIVAAGTPAVLARCEPLLQVIGRHTLKVGDQPEAASALKLANNLVLGCAIEAMGEAFSLVRKYGVAPQVLYDVMTEGLFGGPAYKVYGQIIVDEGYDRAGSTINLNLKDANLILSAGEIARVPLPSGNVFRDRLLSAIAHGDGEKDVASLAREQARASGIE
jgi:3-hydroxyisobutyrate dehydrogenase-like beta-hydroxyacid dehydrogenase